MRPNPGTRPVPEDYHRAKPKPRRQSPPAQFRVESAKGASCASLARRTPCIKTPGTSHRKRPRANRAAVTPAKAPEATP